MDENKCISENEVWEFKNNRVWKLLKKRLYEYIESCKLDIFNHIENNQQDLAQRMLLVAKMNICSSVINFEEMLNERTEDNE